MLKINDLQDFNKNFKNYLLNIVGNCGGLWRKMINFASEISKRKKYACDF